MRGIPTNGLLPLTFGSGSSVPHLARFSPLVAGVRESPRPDRFPYVCFVPAGPRDWISRPSNPLADQATLATSGSGPHPAGTPSPKCEDVAVLDARWRSMA